MRTQFTVRAAGITLACVSVGALWLQWLGARDLLHEAGRGPDVFVKFAFLGEPISWADLNLHDTYYLTAHPAWAWLSVLGFLGGVTIAARPQWVSKNTDGRE